MVDHLLKRVDNGAATRVKPAEPCVKVSGAPAEDAPLSGLPRRLGAPGEEAVVLQIVLAVMQRAAFHPHHRAAGGFEDRLAGGGVPFHRRAVARVEVGLARREHAEFERAAAADALQYRAAP